MENKEDDIIKEVTSSEYKYGFVSDIDSETAPMGLSEDIVRFISSKKNEPEWLLEWRLRALGRFLELLETGAEPTWARVRYPKIDYQDIIYYSAPKQQVLKESLDEVDIGITEAHEAQLRDLLQGLEVVARDAARPDDGEVAP